MGENNVLQAQLGHKGEPLSQLKDVHIKKRSLHCLTADDTISSLHTPLLADGMPSLVQQFFALKSVEYAQLHVSIIKQLELYEASVTQYGLYLYHHHHHHLLLLLVPIQWNKPPNGALPKCVPNSELSSQK